MKIIVLGFMRPMCDYPSLGKVCKKHTEVCILDPTLKTIKMCAWHIILKA